MNKIKRFFKIEKNYQFEWNDLRAIIQIVNVVLIMIFGLTVAWFGLAIAVLGLVKDFMTDRHLNGIAMHISSIVLNIYFISLI